MKTYDEWHSLNVFDDDTSAPWHRFVKNQLKLSDMLDKKILEIGCGRGGFSNYLASNENYPREIVAADYSNSALEIAQQKYVTPLIRWSQQDIMSLNFTNEYFDTVISCETIEHVVNPKLALKELFRVLKPGGKLFLTCPNYFNLFGLWCLYRLIIKKPFTEGGQPYVNYILFPQVFYWLKNIGFKVLYFKSSEFIVPARVPKHFWNESTPPIVKPFGYRTYYVLTKPE